LHRLLLNLAQGDFHECAAKFPSSSTAAATSLVFRVIILDHHKTAFGMFEAPESQHPNLDVQLDMNRSGATIALGYFQPQVRF
jgi:oligoribonuclease NrnB/cAMP/cGMP phosphodiesterase (DHH superfamily)